LGASGGGWWAARAIGAATKVNLERRPKSQALLLATSHLQSAFGWSAISEESAAFFVGAIVELLKYPIAAGPATDVLLEALRMATPGARAGLPANLRWLADTYPAIDFRSAPPDAPLGRFSLPVGAVRRGFSDAAKTVPSRDSPLK
jgi:hypothetical protein